MYVQAEPSIREVIVRHSPTSRLKFVSYFELGFEKEENFNHAQCSWWRHVGFQKGCRKQPRCIINSVCLTTRQRDSSPPRCNTAVWSVFQGTRCAQKQSLQYGVIRTVVQIFRFVLNPSSLQSIGGNCWEKSLFCLLMNCMITLTHYRGRHCPKQDPRCLIIHLLWTAALLLCNLET